MAAQTINDLLNAEFRLRMLIDNVHDYAIFMLDPEGHVATWNSGAERIKGYRAEEIVGKHFSVFYSREDVEKDKPGYELKIAAESGRYEDEGWRIRKDGSPFWANVVITAARNTDGELIGFAKVTRDFTERNRIEHERDASAAQARERALLLELAHDSIIIRDLENRITFWNRGAEEKYRWTKEDALGKVTHSFLQTKFPQPLEEVEKALREKEYWEGELVHSTKDGRRITVASRQVLQRNSQGNPIAIFEINNDITDRKQAEQALQRHEAHLRALFEFSPDAIVVSDQEGKIVSVNSQMERFFGYKREELLGQSIDILVPERFRRNHPSHRRQYEANPRTRPMGAGLELYGRRRDGQEFPIDIMLAPIETPEGKVTLSTIRDISERKQAEEKIRRSEQEKRYLEEELLSSFDEIVGQNFVLKQVLKQVETVAPTDATVLILGETGTGKELIARALHRLSRRHDHTFVKLNCAAIPTGLLESELFGHERGAFTGAIAQKVGRLELAHRGTLFLDEVGDIPLELQPKLLRALQEKEFERLGSTRTMSVDIRLVAATNRDLEKMVADGQFRRDLYYRLKVFPISIPALRDRKDDIPLLVRYFVDVHARRMARQIKTIPPEVMDAFTRWNWPGNVRELENFIERAVILSPGSVLRAPLAELKTLPEVESSNSSDGTLVNTERDHILRILREAKGMISGPNGAAERLGVKRTTLNSKMKKLGITREDYT
ncbi:MAG TPA: sigma 54-interacting transcriptional regulator [Candidatus Acidoferrales bacterium]|nr:sigma 54-interacting transcriptional regulator [Candidatus Acidoferrales bacterium]